MPGSQLFVSASTPKTAEAGFLGSYSILGHGPCPGAPGHCEQDSANADGLREKHHLSPYNLMIDVTDDLNRIVAARAKAKPRAAATKLALSILVLDVDGKQVRPDTVRFKTIVLTTH